MTDDLPEQISNRVQSQFEHLPSCSTIYRYIHKGILIKKRYAETEKKRHIQKIC